MNRARSIPLIWLALCLASSLPSTVAASITITGQVNCTNGGGARDIEVRAYCNAGPCQPVLTTGVTDATGHFSIFVQNCPFCAFDPYYSVWVGNVEHCCRLDGSGSGWYAGEWLVGCGGNCFLEGTRITMADGTTKPIEKIAAGDMILAFDEKAGKMAPDKVARIAEPAFEDAYYKVNDHIRVTRTHPVLSGGKWVQVGELRLGDTLTGWDGKPQVVTKLELVQERTQVFNFAVNPFQTFVAEGIIVHNKNLPTNAQEIDDP